MNFTKMEGLGNDFVVVEDADPTSELIIQMCDRRRGVGADGFLAVDARPSMYYWNADGSPAEMCGNGLRCVARYAVDRGWAPEREWFGVETAVGEREAFVEGDAVTVELGRVRIGGTVPVGDRTFHEAGIGNPHAVTLVDDPARVDVAAEGPLVAADPAFPAGANVEFVKVESPDRLRLRVWERGVGETAACGSGMVVAAAVATGTGPQPVAVEVPGGVGFVHFRRGRGYLSGPVRTVFQGTWIVISEGAEGR